jgi:beta-lactamase class D
MVLLTHAGMAGAPDTTTCQERPIWENWFTEAGVTGTLVVQDERQGRVGCWLTNPARAATPFLPASTFKIPNALFALDAGVIRDELQVVPWDGTRHHLEAWNRDQTLRSAMRASTVWMFQSLARQIGDVRMRENLKRIAYSAYTLERLEQPLGDQLDSFWLGGDRLRITAHEQIRLLRDLYGNRLPFAPHHMAVVRDVMIVEAGRNWILRAKTGWGVRVEPAIGWWVGWVEWPEGPVFFALNMTMPHGADDLPKREEIARRALRSMQALP